MPLSVTNVVSQALSAAHAQKHSAYGYTPTFYVTAIYVVLYFLSTVIHAGQAVFFGTYWMLATACLCGVGETIGWIGRLWSSHDPTLSTPYMMQITTTILAPTPLVAVNFILLGRIIVCLGPGYSRLSPRLYTRIFLSCDIISLLIQAAGGGIAASAHKAASQNLGGNIMLVGIIFQFVALCVYSALAVDFLRNYAARRVVKPAQHPCGAPRGEIDARLRVLLWAMTFETCVLFVRSIYRTIELADGWTGRVITTEAYFNVFDGAMVTLAIWTFNLAHPGLLLLPVQQTNFLHMREGKAHDSMEMDPIV